MKRVFLIVMGMFSFLAAEGITLDSCYTLARNNYPLIKQLDLINLSGQYSFSNAAKAYLPQFTLLGQVSYQSAVPEFPNLLTGIFRQNGIDIAGISKDQYRYLLQLDQLIWDGGATKALRENIKAETRVSELTVENELDALKSRINQLYFGVLILQTNLQLSLNVEKLLNDNTQVVEAAVINGVAMQSDLDNINVELISLQQKREQLQYTIAAFRQMLSLMIGQPISETEIFVKPDLAEFERTNNRNELKLFDAQKAQFNSQRKLLNSTVFPKLALFAQGWYGKPGLNIFDDIIYGDYSWNYIAGVRFQWNIGAFYTRGNNIKKIGIGEQSIDVRRNTFLWNINIQQTQYESEVDKIRKVSESDDEIIRLRTSIREASESKYQNGIITITDLLRDITNENNAIQIQAQHEVEMLKNLYDLKATLNQ